MKDRMTGNAFQISIDTGGTFTDAMCTNGSGALRTAKSPTIPHDPSVGVMNVLRILAEREYGLSLSEFLGMTESIVFGTTVAANALLTLSGAKTAMINTEGFTDILEMRRLTKRDLSNWKAPKPAILVPRHMRFGIEERIKYTGEVITPLNEESVRVAVREAKAKNAEVISVCLLHSYINSKHEQRVAEIIKEEYPAAKVILSSDILPRCIEFSRCATTAVTAYVTPVITRFLEGLQKSLEESGYRGVLLVLTSNGGVETPQVAMDRAATVVGSSMAGGPLTSVFFAELHDIQNVVAIDMGGTSYDVSVIPKRTIAKTTETRIGDQLNAVESVSVDAIGAGGGSIAWLDDRGMLCIGPESAGAEPGPACYGKGGTKPTVTDADIVLGYVPADYFLGGDMPLDVGLARRAIEKEISDPLGIDVVEAAQMIRAVADSTMADHTFLSLVGRGYDPRDFVLYIAGGGGPTHAFDLARHINIREVYIPKVAPVFCTLGMLNADFMHDFMHVLYQLETDVDLEQVNKAYEKMEAEGIELLASEGVSREDINIIKGADIRYYGQATDISVSLPAVPHGLPFTEDNLRELIKVFHCDHNERRGYSDTGMVTQIIDLKLTVVGKRKRVNLPEIDGGGDLSGSLKYHREAFFNELGGFTETPCYNGDSLRCGDTIRGPAIVEERATTIVVPPDAELRVDKFGNYFGKLLDAKSNSAEISQFETVDQTAVSIIEGRLLGICREMGARALQSIQSPSASLWNDLGVVLFDAKERMVAQAEWVPLHSAVSPVVLKNALDYIGRDNLYPGDFIVANHPFIIKGGHLPDWSFIMPLFYQDDLIGYLHFKSHQFDTGGAYPAAYFPRGYDAHAEGLMIPPTKIIERGIENKVVYELILNNVRGRRIVRWDNMVVHGAMLKAKERINEIFDRYGKEGMESAFDQIIAATDKAVKSEISTWPAGVYHSAAAADSDGTIDDPVWVRLALTVKPDEGRLIFDFSESDSGRDFVNTPIGTVTAEVFTAIYMSAFHKCAHNHALYDCATIVAKEGTVCNPIYPQTSGGQGVTLGTQIIECVQLVMAQLKPEDTPAAWSRHLSPTLVGNIRNVIDPRTGSWRFYRMVPFTSDAGNGAIWGYDGWDGVGPAIGSGQFLRPPVEIMERDVPYRVLRCEWITDSAGDGQFRGAIGTHAEYLNEQDPDVFVPGDAVAETGNCDGQKFKHFGLIGGHAAPENLMQIKRRGQILPLKSQDIVNLEPGDVIVTKSGGGGGVGSPLNRDVEKVRMDALDRYISIEKARDVYGVVIDPDTFEVDTDATTESRRKKVKEGNG